MPAYRNAARYANRMTEVQCATCQGVFEANRSTARFCSNACRQQHYRNRAAQPPPKSRPDEERPDLHHWARSIEHISANIPTDDFTADELADAQGAAEFLFYLLRGETKLREVRSR